MQITPHRRLGSLAAVAMLAFAACSSSGGGSSAPAAASGAASSAPPASSAAAPSAAASPAVASASTGGGQVTGSIIVSGSSTVEPISSAVSAAFKTANPGFNYTVEGPGTGDGFKKFCNGETDISDASRQIKDTEAADCKAKGIEYTELKIAIDGLSVMTSKNDAAAPECLSLVDLYALVGPESVGFNKWSDAEALTKQLGSNTKFPDADLVITGPGEESGTFDSFVELAITPTATARKQDATTRPDYTASANDNAIIAGVANSPASLGWVGFAFLEENLDKVKAFQISKDANGTCVDPNDESIASGTYPLSRNLYIYVNKAKAAANPAVVAWVDYYLADGTITNVLKTVPYVALRPEALKATQDAWAAAKP